MASPANSSIFTLLVVSLLLRLAMAAPAPVPEQPPQPSPPGCVGELVMFSPCLAFVSSPPNNLTDTASSTCCDAFVAALNSGEGPCLCYLLRQPRILGFPLNESRVLSLPSVCSQTNDASSSLASGSLEALCSVSQVLPPLQNETNSGISNPPDSAPNNQSSPPLISLPESDNSDTPASSTSDSKNSSTKPTPPPDPAKKPPTPPSPPLELPTSAMADQLFFSSKCWFQMGLLILPVLISICL